MPPAAKPALRKEPWSRNIECDGLSGLRIDEHTRKLNIIAVWHINFECDCLPNRVTNIHLNAAHFAPRHADRPRDSLVFGLRWVNHDARPDLG